MTKIRTRSSADPLDEAEVGPKNEVDMRAVTHIFPLSGLRSRAGCFRGPSSDPVSEERRCPNQPDPLRGPHSRSKFLGYA